MKIELGTIDVLVPAGFNESNNSRMALFYNGPGELITAELGEIVEPLENGFVPDSLESAVSHIKWVYGDRVWNLELA